jgi:hypothetical protein
MHLGEFYEPDIQQQADISPVHIPLIRPALIVNLFDAG